LKIHEIVDPIPYSSLSKVLLSLGFLTGSRHLKTIKNKEYVVEDQITKKILHVLRIPKSAATQVYDSKESVTTIQILRTLLYHLSVPCHYKEVSFAK
jgi:hypothetical protein